MHVGIIGATRQHFDEDDRRNHDRDVLFECPSKVIADTTVAPLKRNQRTAVEDETRQLK